MKKSSAPVNRQLKYPSRWVALQLSDRHLEDEVSELANGKNIIALQDKLEIELREIWVMIRKPGLLRNDMGL